MTWWTGTTMRAGVLALAVALTACGDDDGSRVRQLDDGTSTGSGSGSSSSPASGSSSSPASGGETDPADQG